MAKRLSKIFVAFVAAALMTTAVLVMVMAAAPPAHANIFYAVSNYSSGSAGVITKDGGSYQVDKNLVTNLGGDAAGFTFKDHSGAPRAMVREYHYGPDDTVFIWDPADWKKPVVNKKTLGSNIHAVASDGQYLYLTTYESYGSSSTENSNAEDSGEVVRVDMKNGYTADKRYQYKRFTGESGQTATPHGEAIVVHDGKIYVMFGVSYSGVAEYEPTEVVEFDGQLNRLRSVKLKDGDRVGKNASSMVIHGGKLYVTNMGGYQGPGSGGVIWEVNLTSMSARQVLDGRDMPYELPDGTTAAVGMYGLTTASDGTAFLLTGSYSADYTFRARIFKTTVSGLSAGDKGILAAEYPKAAGYSWRVLWDEVSSVLWCTTGRGLEVMGKDGSLIRKFDPAELGDNVYSISLLNGSGNQVPDPGAVSPGNESGGGCDAGALSIWIPLALVGLAVIKRRI
jgi:hypothetical protein